MNRGSFQMKRRVLLLTGLLLLLGIFLVFCSVLYLISISPQKVAVREASSLPHRKLLHAGSPAYQPDRIRADRCTKEDVVINQGPGTRLPDGIPTYTLEITNTCVTGCNISQIHLTCGWFSPAKLIEPNIFKRIRYNDCLVNYGNPLGNGETLSFQYASSFPYSFTVSSLVCS